MNMFFKHNNQELKSKKLLSVKNKYDPNAVSFYTGFKIYVRWLQYLRV